MVTVDQEQRDRQAAAAESVVEQLLEQGWLDENGIYRGRPG